MRQHAPATVRNREPIAAILAEELPDEGTVLEIASGTGEHASFFAGLFPKLTWQPSDPDPVACASIRAWRKEVNLPNLLPPVALDAVSGDWPLPHAGAVLCINMLHISPWVAAEGLFAGAMRLLSSGAPLVLYGPYWENDVVPAASNLAFDTSLRARNTEWGIRDLAAVDELARRNDFGRTRRIAMPANNLTLVYRKL